MVDSLIAIFGYNLVAQHCDFPAKDAALTLLGTGCTLAAEADGLPETLVNSGARRAETNRQQADKGPILALPRNIILVGFMGTGKSRIGALLAEKTGWEMVDADHEIVRRAGRTIPQIFEQDGESSFRQLERSVIRDLCAGANRVIAAGGGAFADPGNRQEMLASGMVVCLTAQPETIYRRVGHRAGTRPMLAGYDPLDRIKTLLEQRAPSYAQAHHAVATDDLTPEQAAEEIVDLSHRHVDPAR